MNSLSDICKVELENNVDSEYIGITIVDGNPQVIFPRGYNLSLDKNEQRRDVILLIKVFDKYMQRKESKAYLEQFNNLSQGKGSNFPFSNALWLIRDYENNGLYNEYIHNYKVDKKGNINWSRTIKTQTPYISNNKLVYLDFVVKEKRDDINNIILLTQKHIIEKCIENIGWLYPNIYIDRGNKLPYSVQACINILRRELQVTNIDSIKQLIRRMIEFLQYVGNDKSKQKLKEYKTKYFMNIWEDMLNEVLGNEDASEYYPNAQWHIDGNTTDASNLRPDVILKVEKKVYVIDAKYYKYGITGNVSDLPQSSDITKQLLYSSHITSNFEYVLYSYDSFVLPYKSNNEEYFKFVGNATVAIDEFKNKKVVCILADTKKIMEQYINMDEIDKSKESIVKIIDSQNVIKTKEKS
jgi:hypothetical protein